MDGDTGAAPTARARHHDFAKFARQLFGKLWTSMSDGPAAGDGAPTQFSSWLPYRAFDAEREIFVLGHGQGFCLEIAPQSGADQSMIDILRGMYMNWPAGASIQISLFGTPHIQPILKRYVAQRLADEDIDEQSRAFGRAARSENIFRKMARRRYAHLLNGATHSVVQGGNYLLRDYRLVISASLPGQHDDIALREELVRRRSAIEGTLQSAHFPPVRWNPNDLLEWCANFCNPYRFFEEPDPIHYDRARQIRDQIIDFDTHQHNTPSGLVFSKASRRQPIEARMYAVKSYPQYWQLWRMAALVGDQLHASLQYPCPFLLTMGLTFQDPATVSATTTANQMRANQNASSKMAPLMPDVQDKARDWNEALKVVSAGGTHVHLYHSLALFAAQSDIDRAETLTESLWRDQGFGINNVSFMHRNVFLASLPMALSPAIARELKSMRIMSTKSVDNAVALSPLISEWRGSQTPVLMMAGRRGQLAGFDLYDIEGNHNAAVVGTSGSGKSAALAELASSYLATGATVWMLDLGKSFERLCRKASGQWVELFAGCRLNVNPFTHVTKITEDIAMLQGIVRKMAAPFGGLDPVQNQAITTGITVCWHAKGNAMTTTDLRDLFATGKLKLDDEFDRRIVDLAAMLAPYATGGAYAEFFDGPSNIDFNNRLIVIEAEGLKRSPLLHRVVMMILLFRITGAMYLTRNRRKVLIVDELKQQLGNDTDSVIVEAVEEAILRARKYGGALVTAAQTVEHYFETAALRTAFELADTRIILRQSKESIELLAKSGKLVIDEYTKRLLQSLRMVKGAYSEMYVHSPLGQGVLRAILDPYSLLLFSNRLEDNAPLDEKLARGLSIDEAIEELIQERQGRAA